MPCPSGFVPSRLVLPVQGQSASLGDHILCNCDVLLYAKLAQGSNMVMPLMGKSTTHFAALLAITGLLDASERRLRC